jgi:hypothetical protein
VLARLMRDRGTLYLLLGIYFAVNAALRIALPGSLGLEGSRLVFFAQWLAPGYVGQAPLPVWLLHGVTQVIGTNIVAVALLENLLLFLAYWLISAAAFLVIRNRALAIIAVLGMLLLPQVAYELQRDAGPWAAALATSGLFLYALVAMLDRGSLPAYALTGLAIGGGLLANYGFGLLAGAALIAILIEPAFRARLWNWRVIATLLFLGASFSAHALWLGEAFGPVADLAMTTLAGHPSGGDRTSLTIEGLFSLGVGLAGFFLPAMLVFWLSFGRRFPQSWQASNRWTRLVGVILIIGIAAFLLLVLAGGTPQIRDRWLLQVFFLLPLYFSLKLDALNETIGNAPKRFGAVAVIIMIVVPLGLVAHALSPFWGGRYGSNHVPHGPAIAAILAANADLPSLVMAEDEALAGNIKRAAPGLRVVTPSHSGFVKGYPFDATHPLLLVWRANGDVGAAVPERVAALLSSQVEAGAVPPMPQFMAQPHHFGRAGDTYRFAYAWIYPPAP